MYVPGLSVDGHGYSGIRRCSDMVWGGGGGGGGVRPWTIHGCFSGFHRYSNVGLDIPGLSVDGHTYSQWAYADIWIFCPSKVLGDSKVTVSCMDDSGLSMAPSDNPCYLATSFDYHILLLLTVHGLCAMTNH